MSYEVRANPVFEIDKERLLKSRPLAHTDIAAAFESLRENPRQADRIPGIGALDIRKARWPMKSYRIGSSAGLRIVFAIRERVIIPLAIWHKREMTNEQDVLAHVKKRVKESIASLQGSSRP